MNGHMADLTVDWLLMYGQAMNGHLADLTLDWLLMYGQAMNGHMDVSDVGTGY